MRVLGVLPVSNIDTQIRCQACKERVQRGHIYCPNCGEPLSPSQLRASAVARMQPLQFRSLLEDRLAKLAMKPAPLSAESLRLHRVAGQILAELRLLGPEDGVSRALLDRILGWSSDATAELQRKEP